MECDCFDWQWVDRFWSSFAQLFSEMYFNSYPGHFLEVKCWTRYLGFEICLFWCSLLFLSGIFLTSQLCQQYLGLCVINLKAAQSSNKSVTAMTFLSFLFQSMLSACSPGSLSWSLCWLLQFSSPAVHFCSILSTCLSTSGPLLNCFSQKTYPKMMYLCVFCWLWVSWRF